uniref:Uncharacterized protein n=1 Tax=Arundo donax TaxID=35708 RepID=A0A0A9KF40_ARUDO
MSTTSDCVHKFLTNNFDVNGFIDLVVVWTLMLNDMTSLSVTQIDVFPSISHHE